MSKHGWMVAVVLALAGASAALADGPPEQPKMKHGRIGIERRQDVMMEFGDHWLGLEVSQVSEALQAQLNLPAGEGLVVENVVPEGPAAKAAVQRFDVLVKAGDTRLHDIRDLMGEINKAKEGKLKIELIRGGKRQTVTATPAVRPRENMGFMQFPMSPGADREKIEAWIREMAPQFGEGKPLQFHFFHPGQILPPGAAFPKGAAFSANATVRAEMTLPDGYKMEIVRENGNPTKITVTRGKEKWEATEGDLSKLPEKVRPEVEKFLHSGPFGVSVFTSPVEGPSTFQIRTAPFHNVGPQGHDPRLEKRLDEMNRLLEKLRKDVEELRKATPQKKP